MLGHPSRRAGAGPRWRPRSPAPHWPLEPVLHFLVAGSKLLIAALSCLEIGGNYNSKRLNKPLQRLELALGTLPDGPVVNESLLKGQLLFGSEAEAPCLSPGGSCRHRNALAHPPAPRHTQCCLRLWAGGIVSQRNEPLGTEALECSVRYEARTATVSGARTQLVDPGLLSVVQRWLIQKMRFLVGECVRL